MKLAIRDNAGILKMVDITTASDKIVNAIKDSNPVKPPPVALPEVELINDNPYIDNYCFFCGEDDKSQHDASCMYFNAAAVLMVVEAKIK